jgi:hypothetical protein
VDTLIVAGRTQPNAVHVEDMTAALFYRAPEPIQRLEGPAYPRELRGYRMADESRFGVEADVHPDSRVEAVRRQICEAEIVQAVGRGRPARRSAERPLKVILLTSVPLPLTVHHLTRKDALLPDPIEVLAARGAIPVEPWADLAEAYPDLFASADAARMTISRTLTPNTPLRGALIGLCSELREVRYRRRRPNRRAVTGTLFYHPVRIDPALWLAEQLPGAEILKDSVIGVPITLRIDGNTHADFGHFRAHEVQNNGSRTLARRRALVIRCDMGAEPPLSLAALFPGGMATT